MNLKYLSSLCLLIAITVATGFAQKPVGLMCNLLANTDYRSIDGYVRYPKVDGSGKAQDVRITSRKPSFSWMINSARANYMQTAYQILLSDGNAPVETIFWDSGKIKTRQSAGVNYTGPALQPGHQYYWKVRVWDNAGKGGPYSDKATFTMGQTLTDYATDRYPVQKTDEQPTRLEKNQDVYFADFGKDAFGQLKFRLTSKTGHDTVTIRLGEVLDHNKTINRKPPGTIRYAEYQLPLQAGTHDYQLKIRADKRNTGPNAIKMPDYIGEVMPFRYCEVHGYKQTLQAEDITRAFVHYPFNDDAASFHSSDTLLNKIWELCKYTVKATSFAGVYVDGDRERIPYEADAYINQLCHYAVDREYSLARYSHEYLIDHATWPTEWILQSVLMAGNDYLYTGDIRSAGNFYGQLKAKSLMSLEDANGLISSKNTTPQILSDIHIIMRKEPNGLDDIVDWPHTGGLGLKPGYGGETDGFVFTEYNAVVNAYYYKALVTMQMLAKDLGKKADAAMFQKKAALVKQRFNELFWDAKQGVFCDGITTRHASLHTNAFALAFGLSHVADKERVMAFVKSRGMACSVYGSQFVLDAVYEAGDGSYGLQLLTSKEKRSWFNMIDVGSTLTLEAWDNEFKPNQDWNHVWGAAPANIISRKLMGVEPLTPGWSTFKIAPQPGTLTQADITVPTIKGTISVNLKQDKSSLSVRVVVPANTIADIYLPRKNNKDQLWLNNKRVAATQSGKSWLISKVGSGTHNLAVKRV